MARLRLLAWRDALSRAQLRARPRKEPSSGLLLVTSGGLGDTILLALVLPRLVARARPGETAAILMRREAARMAFLFPPGIEVIAVDYNRLARDAAYRAETFRALYDRHFRLVVSTDYLRHPWLDEAMISACAAEQALAMEPRPWPKHDSALQRNRGLYARRFDSGPPARDKVLRWAAFADWLSGRSAPPPRIVLPADRLAPPADLAGPTVVIQPFSAVKAKQSPPSLYAALIDSLPAGTLVRIAGAPSDLERNPEFASLLERPNVSFDGSTFEQLVPILRAARLVVSVDTACMHLAVAVGAPTLCLASAAYVGEIVPYAAEITPPNARFLFQPMDCQGCLGDCRLPAIGGMYPCVAALEPAAVIAAAREMLA